jgi:hypothetical protein
VGGSPSTLAIIKDPMVRLRSSMMAGAISTPARIESLKKTYAAVVARLD